MASATYYPVDDGCICQIPGIVKTSETEASNGVEYIAVLDASGSMCEVWPFVARAFNKFQESTPRFHCVTFDHHSYEKGRVLSESLDDNGGGGTNIRAGMERMKELVTRLRHQGSKSFLVIFVSDGHDGYNSREALTTLGRDFDLEGMEFTTVGVGYGFPTHVSMSLRNAFHQGRENIPNVTLVEEIREFEEDFGKLACEILGISGEKVSFGVPGKVAPWKEPVEEVYEKTWVMLGSIPTQLIIQVGEDCMEVELKESEWTYTSSEAVLRQWMHMLHAQALAGKDVRPDAAPAAELGKQIAEKVEAASQQAIDVASSDGRKCPSVYQRLQKKLMRETHELSRLLKELRNLSEGDILSDLSDADLAQRLAIGTKEGKHHQRAMKWKGVTQIEFKEYLANFEKLMNDCLPALKEGPEDDNRSAVSLESNGDVLLQDDLLQAIQALPSQYHLVECVPIVGQPVLTRVTNASMINPWMVSVKSVSRVCPCVDTCTLQEMADAEGVTQLSLGYGEVDPMNAVCPLFSKEVADCIGPFFRSKLYSMLMTHVVSKNIDTVDRDSHPALLAALMCYLLVEPQSSWRDGLIEKIVETTKNLYLKRGPLAKTVEALKTNPEMAMVTEHPSIESKCQELSKPMLLSICVADELSADQKAQIVQRLYLEHIGRILVDDPALMDWFSVSGMSGDDGEITSQLSELGIDYKTCDTLDWLKKKVRKKIAQLEPKQTDESQLTAAVCMDKVEARSKSWMGPVSLKVLKAFAAFLCGEENTPEICFNALVYHGCVHKNSFDRASNPVLEESKAMEQIIAAALRQDLNERKRKLQEEVFQQAENIYNEHFGKAHRDLVLPMSWDEIVDVNQKRRKIAHSPEELGYNPETGLCLKACMCPSCEFYLLPNKRLNNHLDTMRKNEFFIKAYHRCIRELRHESLAKIKDAVKAGDFLIRDPKMTFERQFETFGDAIDEEIMAIKMKYIQLFD